MIMNMTITTLSNTFHHLLLTEPRAQKTQKDTVRMEEYVS